MCAVNGSMYGEKQSRGFTMDESGIIKDIWGPLNVRTCLCFVQPICVCYWFQFALYTVAAVTFVRALPNPMMWP